MISLGSIQFVTPWALLLLLALPIWWIVRRRTASAWARREDAAAVHPAESAPRVDHRGVVASPGGGT